MSDASSTDLLRRALTQIRDLKDRLAADERRTREPIAIVGMGLRLPGDVTDARSFADLLWSGVDPVGVIPDDRWSPDSLYDADAAAPGRMTTRHGAFLRDLDRFDAPLFGIAPREAQGLDPQHRLLLETSWEALENAGIAPLGLAGSATGVYLGIGNNDHARAVMADPERLDAYASTGTAYSTAVGRLSYTYGLQGPAIAVDTACSASLVAVHLAIQGLRGGDCDLALIAGVNCILSPELNIVFSKAAMLAPDGRCKTFSADADGYGRGEGCVVLVARRLADAQARGERILGLVLGSATNQDGRSAGLTAPSGPAQEAVIRAALATAGVTSDQIDYVEAHGTGTPLGDPIEIGALGRVFGPSRSIERPLLVGSVKSNIGHLEAAAGLAGLAKILLAFDRGELPANLHFAAPSPHIDWDALPVRVTRAATAWPAGGRRLAGLSSFGFGGSNAHIVLEAPPETASSPTSTTIDRPVHILPLSARDGPTLERLARRYLAVLDDMSIADLCHTAAVGRSPMAVRLAVVGADARALRAALETAITGAASWRAVPRQPASPGFVAGIAANDDDIATLRATSPTFARAFDASFEAGTAGTAAWAGLIALWNGWGVTPRVIAGTGDPVEMIAGAGGLDRVDAIDGIAIPLGGNAGDGIWDRLAGALAAAWQAGVAIDWRGVDRDYARRIVSAPTYPFDRQRHWLPHLRAFRQVDDPAPTLAERVPLTAPAARSRMIVDDLRTLFEARRAPGQPPLAIDTDLRAAGVDTMADATRVALIRVVGIAVPPMLLMNHRTIAELAEYLLKRLHSPQPPDTPMRAGAGDSGDNDSNSAVPATTLDPPLADDSAAIEEKLAAILSSMR